MEKFVPFEKLSKKEQKKLNSAKRRDWNGLDPVTQRRCTGASPSTPRASRNKKAPERILSGVLCYSLSEISWLKVSM